MCASSCDQCVYGSRDTAAAATSFTRDREQARTSSCDHYQASGSVHPATDPAGTYRGLMLACNANTLHEHDPTNANANVRAKHVERLLDELRESVGPSTWPRVEELVRVLVGLYGEGLARLLAHAREEVWDLTTFAEKLTADEVIAGLLALHGLHPIPVRTRIESALHEVEAMLSSLGGRVVLSGIDSDVAHVRLSGFADENAARVFARQATYAIQKAAPEIDSVSVEGLPESQPTPQVPQLIALERLIQGGQT